MLEYIHTLYDCTYWATGRVLAAAARLSPDQFVAPTGGSYGSLRGTLAHTLSAEWIWRMRFAEGESPSAKLAESDFSTLEDLRQRWQTEERAMRGFLAGLDNDDLQRVVHYHSTKGRPHQNILWQLLVHLANHGTQHRSEAAVVLTEFGASPGDLDFIVYLRIQQ
jgi:uncharacterized damage-inducible protein DinB